MRRRTEASFAAASALLLGCSALVDAPQAKFKSRAPDGGNSPREPVAAPESGRTVTARSLKAGDFFGAALALDGDDLTVAAPGATIFDIPSSAESNCEERVDAKRAGRIFNFERRADEWSESDELLRKNASDNDGVLTLAAGGTLARISVARSGDTIAVGVPARDINRCWPGSPGAPLATISQAGEAYVFERDVNGHFALQTTLRSPRPEPDGTFGVAIALRSDRLFISAPGDNEPPPNGTEGAFDKSGTVFVYARDGDGWRELQHLKAKNAMPRALFGSALSVSGDTLAVGAWLDSHGEHGVDPEPTDEVIMSSGAAYVFRERDGVWEQEAYLKSVNPGTGDQIGSSIALEQDTLLVGAPLEGGHQATMQASEIDPLKLGRNEADTTGAVHVFRRRANHWSFDTLLKAPQATIGAAFGFALSIQSGRVLVAAVFEPVKHGEDEITDVGAAYLYDLKDDAFVERMTLRPNPPLPGDLFGYAVALSADRLAIGAIGAPGATGYVRVVDLPGVGP